MRYFAFPAFVLLVTNLVLRLIHGPDPVPQLPRLMLWAWESPQDLRFIPPGKAGIAFLAQTIWLNRGRVRSRPRLQPLRFNPRTDLVAVVRFESEGKGLPPQAEVIREIAPVLKIAAIRALQIDFDARESEHQNRPSIYCIESIRNRHGLCGRNIGTNKLNICLTTKQTFAMPR